MGAGRRAVSRVRPTARGGVLFLVGAVAACAAAWLGRGDLLFAGLVASGLVVGELAGIGMRRPRLAASFSLGDGTVASGGTATRVLRVRNLGERVLPAGSWWQRLPGGLAGPERDATPRLAPYSHARGVREDGVVLEYPVRALRRGVFPLPAPVLRVAGPFGLARLETAVGGIRRLVVTPAIEELDPGRLRAARGLGLRDDPLRPALPDADEPMAREYRPGDPRRRIHWRATARHGSLMVRQEERETGPEALLLLDTVVAGEGARRRRARDFESSVRLAGSIGVLLVRAGYRLTVAETGVRQLRPGSPVARFEGEEGAGALAAALAGVRPAAPRPAATPLAAPAFGERRLGILVVNGPGAVPAFEAVTGRTNDRGSVCAFLVGARAAGLEERFASAGVPCVRVGTDESAVEAWSRAFRGVEDPRG